MERWNADHIILINNGTAYASLATPLGKIFLAADTKGLCGLWFAEQNHGMPEITDINDVSVCVNNKVFAQTRLWLDVYFSGQKPEFAPAINLYGTPFQLLVWNLLLDIPFGESKTYGSFAKKMAKRLNVSKMSAQAIGRAVGRNPVSIIVCRATACLALVGN